ncbi:MAG: hypothetical protein IPG45_24895 [Deltaproteobacteria bacterium]|nr:hypothetical protein [Deltaproteobacteria bacterium]
MVLEVRRTDAPAPQLIPAEGPSGEAPVGGAEVSTGVTELRDRGAAWVDNTSDTNILDGAQAQGVPAPRPAPEQVGNGVPFVPGPPSGGLLELGAGSGRNRAAGIYADDRILLAQARTVRDPNIATDAPTGLQVGSGRTQGATATGPGAPIDLARMEALNQTIQSFNGSNSPIPASEISAVKADFQTATDALRRGDYAAAQQALGRLGFPLPTSGPLPSNNRRLVTAHMLGAAPATGGPNGAWNVGAFTHGARGNQSINDLNGFAANAQMMTRLGNTASNPPTEAQLTSHMRSFGAANAQGQRPDAAQVMTRASELVNGSIMHYSSAGASDPTFGDNANPRFSVRTGNNQFQVYNTEAEARAAVAQQNLPRGSITRLQPRVPDEWSDISAPGTRSGRAIGDCQSKAYLQTRLLTEAGFTSLGSVDVQGGGGAHMFGAFRSPDGRTFVTSNETFREVNGTGTNGAVTQADLDRVVQDMTADVFHVRPNAQGVRDTSSFTFSSARTDPAAGANAGVASIRAAVENRMLHRSQPILP